MIRSVKDVIEDSKRQLGVYQKGEKKPIVTGREWVDETFGGALPGDIITIAGMSGGGKSFETQRLKNNVMNIQLNPSAGNYIWLDFSMEMRFLSTMIRDLNRVLKKSKKRILNEPFTKEEMLLAKDYEATLADKRFFIDEDVKNFETFKKDLIAFIEQHKDKEAVWISIDHIALFKGDDKKQTIDRVIEFVNETKKLYPNTYWVILSQLNREILKRIKERDMCALPNRGDLFQSDNMFFISDYVYVTHNPFKIGIIEFLKVNVAAYDYIAQHFTKVKDGKTSFNTIGKIFYIVLKARENDVIYKDIFVEDIGIPGKDKYQEPKKDDIAAPIFGAEVSRDSEAIQSAKGIGFDMSFEDDDEESPF